MNMYSRGSETNEYKFISRFLHNLSFPRHCNLTWTQALPVENYKIKTQSAGCTKVYVIHLLRLSDRKGRKRQIVPAKSQNS